MEAVTGTAITWERRLLASCGDQSLAEVAGRYDVVTIDHSLKAEAATSSTLIQLDEHVPPRELTALADGTAGLSLESYAHGGHQWALPVDAACQVSAVRLDRPPVEVPQTWADLVAVPMQFGATLGGVDLAIPAQSERADFEVGFVRWACSSKVQRDYLPAEAGNRRTGSPGMTPTWTGSRTRSTRRCPRPARPPGSGRPGVGGPAFGEPRGRFSGAASSTANRA
jgi:hypothetical protein